MNIEVVLLVCLSDPVSLTSVVACWIFCFYFVLLLLTLLHLTLLRLSCPMAQNPDVYNVVQKLHV